MMRKLMVVTLLVCLGSSVAAAKSDDLAKTANNLIRQAENSFFSGNPQEAQSLLDQAASQIEALKAEDPGHKSIKTLETKFERLKKRVDEKLSGAPASKSPTHPPAGQPAAASSQLSTGAVQTLANAGKEIDAAQAALAQARESLAQNDFNLFGTRLYKAGDRLGRAKGLLERAERSYKIGSGHPEADPLYRRYSDLEIQIAALRTEGEGRQNRAADEKRAAAEQSAALDEKWIPRFEAFIQPTGASYIDFPMIHDPQQLSAQDRKLEAAKQLLADYEKAVPAGGAGPRLEKAAADLRLAIENYSRQKNAGVGDMQKAVEDELVQWARRFEQNKAWKEDSDRSLFSVGPGKNQGPEPAHRKAQGRGTGRSGRPCRTPGRTGN